MRLKQLTLTNFKAIKSLTINPNGENFEIKGQNGTGKTTVNDAFSWCLKGKDTENRTENNFGIKTKIDNVVQHNLVHAVEAVLLIGNKETTVKREYKEIWTKKRGSNTKSFTGHTTDYYIDEVPMTQKEFDIEIDKIIACDFALYSNPMYFSEKLKEADRRKMLIDAFGNVEDADVIAMNKDLKPLIELLENKTIDKIIATSKGLMKAANAALEEIPARIDELQHSVNNIINEDESEDFESLKSTLEADKMQHMISLSKIKAEAGKSTIDNAISAKLIEIAELKSKFGIDRRNSEAKGLEAIRDLESQVMKVEIGITNIENKKHASLKEISKLDAEVKTIRESFKTTAASTYEQPEIVTVCPTCGQDIQADKIQAAKDEGLAIFNEIKAKSLETKRARGLEINASIENHKELIVDFDKELKVENAKLEELNKQAMKLGEEIKSHVLVETWTKQEAQLEELKKQKAGEITVDLVALCEADNKAIEAIDERLAYISTKMANQAQTARNKARIIELMAKEEAATKSHEENEAIIVLCEQFTADKMTMLSDIINSEFELVNFKLFNRLINGTVNECCEVVGKDGVAWSESINTGQRINLGLDIIKTLGRVNGIEMPIFVDNNESVTAIQPLDNQIIKLTHDGIVKELTYPGSEHDMKHWIELEEFRLKQLGL